MAAISIDEFLDGKPAALNSTPSIDEFLGPPKPEEVALRMSPDQAAMMSHSARPEVEAWRAVPEMPLGIGWGGGYHIATTPKGQVNVIKQKYPDAELDFVDGQPVVKFTQDPFGKGGTYLLNRPGVSAQDIGMISSGAARVAPSIAAGVATAGAGWAPALLAAGAVGAGAEAAAQKMADIEGAKEGWNVQAMAISGGLATVGEGFGRLLAKGAQAVYPIAKRLMGKAAPANPVLPDGSFHPALVRAARDAGMDAQDMLRLIKNEQATIAQADIPGALPLEQQLRLQRAAAAGVDPDNLTLGQITRDPMQWQQEVSAQTIRPDSGGPTIAQRWAGTEAQLGQGVQKLIPEGANMGAGPLGQSVMDVTKDTAKEYQQQVSQLYKQAMEEFGDDYPIKLGARGTLWQRLQPTPDGQDASALLTALEEVQPIEGSVNAAWGKQIFRKLQQFGVLSPKAAYDEPGSWEVMRSLRLKEADQLTKLVNAMDGDTPVPRQAKVLGALRNAIDEDVANALGKDPLDQAKAQAAKRFSVYRAKGRGSINKLVTDIADGRLLPSEVANRVVYGPIEYLQSVKGAMTQDLSEELRRSPQLKAKALNAWKDIQAKTLADLFDAGIGNQTATDVTGVIPWNRGNGFNRALKDIGDDKLSILFDKDTVAKLKNIASVSVELKQPNITRSVVNPSGTAAQLMRDIASIIEKVPLAGRFVTAGIRDLTEGMSGRRVVRRATQRPMLVAAQQAKQAAQMSPLASALIKGHGQASPIAAWQSVYGPGSEEQTRNELARYLYGGAR